MMQAAEHRDRGDAGGTREQNAVTGNRDPLAESLVRPRLVEVAEGIFPQHVYQVALAQDDQVVDTLAPHAPKESLAHGIHQGRLHCRLRDPQPRAFGNAIEDCPVLVVAISDQEARSFAERRGIAELLRRPLLGRSARYRDVDHALGVQVDNEEREQRAEPNIVGLQEIAGPDGMVAQERLPWLPAMHARRTSSAHVSLDGPLRDANAELEQFTADPLGSPEPILSCHAPNERDDVRGEARLVRRSTSRPPTPPEPESFAMPAKQGIGLDQEQGVTPQGHEPREQDKQSALVPRKVGRLTEREATMSCCRSSAFSTISSLRERPTSAIRPPSRGKGPLTGRKAARNALAVRRATEQICRTSPFSTSPMWPIGDDRSSPCSMREAGR